MSTITVDEPFSLLGPLGRGTVKGSISSIWVGDYVKVTVKATTTVIVPETSTGFASADVRLEGRSPETISMRTYRDVWIPPNSAYREGSRTLRNVSPESKVTVDLRVNAWTNTWDPSSSNYHLVTLPPKWRYVLREGTR